MEGYRRRELRTESVKRPEKFGGRKNFTRSMLLAALAAFNAPDTAHAEQMPQGTKRAIERLDENVHRKAARHIESSVPRAEDLDQNIQLVEAKLGPGGEWASLLDDPSTSPERVHEILRYVSTILQHMQLLQAMPEAFADQPHALERRPPKGRLFYGNATREFVTIGPTGETSTSFCNGYHVATGGARFFVTAEHCVRGTTEEHLFEKSGNGRDIAVQYLPDDNGPAMQLDTKTDQDYQGRMAVIRATDRFGKDFVRTSFLIKMSPALQSKIFPKDAKMTGFDMTGQFMLLAEPGDATLLSDGEVPASGVSGARIAAWVDGGYRALGPQSAAVIFDTNERLPHEQQVGLRSPMLFAEGVDALVELCERAREHYEQPKRPPEEASGFLQRTGN